MMACASLLSLLMIDAHAYVSPGFNGYTQGRTYNTTEYYKIAFKTNHLGRYEVAIDAYEIPSNEWLPIIDSSYFKTDSLSVSTEVDNMAPSATYSAQGIIKVDVVFATGELSQSQAMQDYMDDFEAQLNASVNNIDAYVEKVETSTISSEGAGAQIIYDTWQPFQQSIKSGFSVSGNILVAPNAESFAGFFDPNGFNTTDIDFTTTFNTRDIGQMTGIIFRLNKRADGKYDYYFFGSCAAFHTKSFSGSALFKVTGHDILTEQQVNGGGPVPWMINGDSRHGNSASDSSTPSLNNYYWVSHCYDSTGPWFRYDEVGVTKSGGKWAETVTMLATYAYPQSNYLVANTDYTLNISASGGHIIASLNGREIFNIIDSNPIQSGSYGFANISNTGTNYSNANIIKGVSKTLGEAIQDVAWRDGSVRFVVHATDVIPQECDPSNGDMEEDYAYTVAKILNANCYLVNLGNNTNLNALNKLLNTIVQADGTVKGTFIHNKNPNITVAMDKSVNYIIEIAKKFNKPVDWVLVNTEIKWNTIYKDSEKDPPLNLGEHNGRNAQPQDKSDIQLAIDYGLGNAGRTLQFKEEKILAEKWRYRHYNNFFDNSPIQVTYHMIWIEDPISIFEYPGKYRINYKRRDNPLYPNVSLEDAFDSYRYWSTDYDYKTNTD